MLIGGDYMKKKYIKPSALIQDMTVNSFAAGLCSDSGAAVLHYGEDSCEYVDPQGGITFFSSNCEKGDMYSYDIVNPNPQSPFAQLCYHRPLDALAFFSS